MAEEKKPLFRVYTLCPREHDKPYWLNIGMAFQHKDGKGWNLMLQALPLDDKLIIREYDPDANEPVDPPEEMVATLPRRRARSAAKADT